MKKRSIRKSLLNESGDQTKNYQMSKERDEIDIHVVDDINKVDYNCKCEKMLLIKEMQFFQRYFESNVQSEDDTAITVHCDVNTFQWLLNYVKKTSTSAKSDQPELSISNVLSILVASEFLEMKDLFKLCTEYFCCHFDDMVSLHGNMTCIQPSTFDKIASHFEPDKLSQVKDKRNRFKSKIFEKKIKDIINEVSKNTSSVAKLPILFRCQACGILLTSITSQIIPCLLHRRVLNLHGEWIPIHKVPTSSDNVKIQESCLDVNFILTELHKTFGSWQSTYWCVWNAANCLFCSICNQYFQPSELTNGCRRHLQPLKEQRVTNKTESSVVSSSLKGQNNSNCVKRVSITRTKCSKLQKVQKREFIYPCCNLKSSLFDPFAVHTGCVTCAHDITKLQEANDPVASMTIKAKQWLESIRISIMETKNESTLLDPVSLGNKDDASSVYFNKLVLETAPYRSLALSNRGELAIPFEKEMCVGQLTIQNPSTNEIHIFESHSSLQRGVEKKITPIALVDLPKSFDVSEAAVWDSTKSFRFNQDTQRQDDLRRMKILTEFLVSLRKPTADENAITPKKPSGGIIVGLEADWRSKIGTSTVSKLPNLLKTKLPPSTIPFR